MDKKKVFVIVGTRPNFVKITQFRKYAENFDLVIVHTGQHYDDALANVFFEQFRLEPDIYLGIEPNSPGIQIGQIITKLCELIQAEKPDFMFVVGDVNSTLAAAIAANKESVLFGHVEAGLRSFDLTMPEEINRLVVDDLADYYFVTEDSGLVNLKARGVQDERIHFVGNTMIDTLVAFETEIEKSDVLERYSIPDSFYLFTMHRPSNVDTSEGLLTLYNIFNALVNSGKHIVFPMHPRTKNNIEKYGLESRFNELEGVQYLLPLDYFSFQKLISTASVVITDSGGIQEETTFRQVPCVTLRDNTERPSTITLGTNVLCEYKVDDVLNAISIQADKTGKIPELWDGQASKRIFEALTQILH